MERMDKIYQQLTGVNIEEQKQLWDERGKGYYGEFLVFRELYQKIPGVCKILMNLQIPTPNGKPTEIDLLMIHENGLYVFEVKHYKGTIFGKPTEANWTQYFRTAKNNTFRNPVYQNQYHINAIRRKFPGIPVHSFIVFTNPACDLRLEGSVTGTTICTLDGLLRGFQEESKNKSPVFNMEQIDGLFGELKEFSPIMNETVTVNGAAIPFYRYIEFLKEDFQEALKQNEKKVKKAKSKALIACIVFGFLMLSANAGVKKQAEEKVLAANQELATFAQKFERVEEFKGGEIQLSKDLILASDVVLEESPDVENAVEFSCSLKWNGSDYGVSIGEEAVLIVILQDGSVKEYALWNESYPYGADYRLGKWDMWYGNTEGKIPVHEFYDMAMADIAYIKLANLGVYKKLDYNFEDVATGYEVELYSQGVG